MPTRKTIKEVAQEEPQVIKESVKKPTPRKYKAGDMVPCKCVRPNKVIFHSGKTDNRYYWYGYGDVVEVDYADLMAMKSAKMSYLYKPLIVILDDELIQQWSRDLSNLYSNFTVYENLDDFFELSNSDFEEKLSASSPGFQDLIKTITARKIKDGTLDSRKKIQIIDEILKTDFSEFA